MAPAHDLPPLIVSRCDLERLERLLERVGRGGDLDRLPAELDRAAVLVPDDVLADVATMNARVRVVAISYPPEAAGDTRPELCSCGEGGLAVLHSFTRCDLAIDLGTAATRLHAPVRSAPRIRPSVVWRPGGARAALHQGVVVDGAAAVLGDLLRKAGGRGWRRPRARGSRWTRCTWRSSRWRSASPSTSAPSWPGCPGSWRPEVADAGLCLTGGGALLGGMGERLVAEFGSRCGRHRTRCSPSSTARLLARLGARTAR